MSRREEIEAALLDGVSRRASCCPRTLWYKRSTALTLPSIDRYDSGLYKLAGRCGIGRSTMISATLFPRSCPLIAENGFVGKMVSNMCRNTTLSLLLVSEKTLRLDLTFWTSYRLLEHSDCLLKSTSTEFQRHSGPWTC